MNLSEEQLVTQHLPMVRRLAWQMLGRLPSNVEIDDLIQAGLMGLLDAVRRYEQQEDAQFETYAITRIRGAMIDELRSQDWLPRSVRSKARSIEEAMSKLMQDLQREPTETEIAQELNIPIEEYHSMLEDAHGVQILYYEDFNRNSESDDSGNALDYTEVDDNDGYNPFKNIVSNELRLALVQAISDLPEREKLLLSLQFEQDLNQKEIAAVLEVSEGRVSQIRSQAIARIRATLNNSGWGQKPEEIDLDTLL